jgi:hypothetical protein
MLLQPELGDPVQVVTPRAEPAGLHAAMLSRRIGTMREIVVPGGATGIGFAVASG